MIDRRRVLFAGGALLASARLALAQTSSKVNRIGCIPGGTMKPREHQWAAFRRGLRELGYVEGRNVALEFRFPQREGGTADQALVELLRMKVDVLVVSTALHAHEAKRATTTVPIVLTGTTDPVAQGLVASMARPGGNVTGMSLMSAELSGKRLEVMKDLLPKAKRIAFLINPNDPSSNPQLKEMQQAARRTGMEIITLEARAPGDLAGAVQTASARRADGLIVASSGLFYGTRERIMELARNAKLPDLWPWGSFGNFGALLVYGPSDTENYRRAAAYVDRILKGARPTDLPIEQATSVEFVVNLKAAKTLGVKVPQTFLMRATHVIQ